jgi:predicted O-linked N-acetylglucosamine transferase (SPINDLY family)
LAQIARAARAGLSQAGLNFTDYGVFIPWQPRPSFYGLMKRATVFLDTIGFSGFNTAMQAVDCGLPIVTREGRFMRGRLASGILKRIGLHELIAASDDDMSRLRKGRLECQLPGTNSCKA